MVWVILAMLCSSLIIMLGAAASRNASALTVAAVLGVSSTIVPVIMLMLELGKKNVQTSRFGFIMSILTGVAVAIYSITLAKAYTFNKVGVVIPIVFGGAIVISTIASYFIFKEKVGWLQGCGLVLVLAGFCLVIYARMYAK